MDIFVLMNFLYIFFLISHIGGDILILIFLMILNLLIK
jgi:hypothetical protein